MGYVRRSARISLLDGVRNETVVTKKGMKEDILQGTKQGQWESRIAELLDRLQNRTHRGKVDAEEQ